MTTTLPLHPNANANCDTCHGTGISGTGRNPEIVERCDMCEVFPTDHHARAYACQVTGACSDKGYGLLDYTVYVMATELHRETYEVQARSEEEAKEIALSGQKDPDNTEYWETTDREIDEVDCEEPEPRFWFGSVLHNNGTGTLAIRDRSLPPKTADGKDRFVLEIPYPKLNPDQSNADERSRLRDLARKMCDQLNAMSKAALYGLVVAE